MVMRSALGAKGTPYEVDIERGKVGEFARAIGSRHPAFLLRDKAVSPPTFLATIFFWEDRVQGANPWSQVEMSQERGMHAEQAYELVGGPPRAGERLVATSEIDGIWDKESRSAGTLTFVRMTTTFVNEAGEVRARSILTGVETSKAPERGPAVDAVAAPSGDGWWRDAAPTPVGFDGVRAGSEPPPRAFGPITRTDIVRYQGASGDMNPVHHDEPFARASGFPAPLGVGMLTAGLMTTWATDWVDPALVTSVRIRWKKPMFPGALVTFSGVVSARDEDAGTAELTLTGRDEAGAELVSGTLTLDRALGAS